MNPQSVAKRLRALALDLRWSWCPTTQRAFAALDPHLWEACAHGPLELLRRVHPARLAARAEEESFLALLAAAEARAADYHGARHWWERTHAARHPRLRIAYFCSEFAIHESIPTASLNSNGVTGPEPER
jgi:starch phosphorylase